MVVLVDGVVEHALPEPVDVDDVVLEDVVVEGAIKVAVVLKEFDVAVPDEPGGRHDDGDD